MYIQKTTLYKEAQIQKYCSCDYKLYIMTETEETDDIKEIKPHLELQGHHDQLP